MRRLLADAGAEITASDAGVLEVRGMPSEAIGETAAANGVVLHELAPEQASLEEAFMRLTHDAVEYSVPGREPAEVAR